jgi:colanic acid/amylovoran biosynthesis glycosyltransferase
MRIILIGTGIRPVTPSGAGGIERYIYHLGTTLSNLGCDTLVIDIQTKSRAQARNFRVQEVWVPPFKGGTLVSHIARMFFFCTQTLFILFKKQRKGEVDVIHTHTQLPLGAIMLLKRLLRLDIPIVHTWHVPYMFYQVRPYGEKIEIQNMKRADYVVTLTTSVRNRLLTEFGISPSKIVVIPTGIDEIGINNFLKQTSHRCPSFTNQASRVLCVARICRRKNQLTILKAAVQVHEKYPNAKFIFVGPIDEKSYFDLMSNFILKNKLSEVVEIMGEIPANSLYEQYASATIYVLTSLDEVQPQSILEAMYFGLPVIAPKTPIIQEILGSHGQNALLIDPNNPEEVAAAILHLLKDCRLRKYLGAKGRKITVKYSWSRIAKNILELYSRVTKPKNR